VTFTETPVNVTTYRGPYPNPVSDGPVHIEVITPGSASIEMDIFTTAFRKIVGHSVGVYGAPGANGVVTSLDWDLRDHSGARIANGLYYLRVHVTGIHESTKIFKVLVLR
jgi:hypothetical protein